MTNLIFGKKVIYTILEERPNYIKKVFLSKNDKSYFKFKKMGIEVFFWNNEKFEKNFPNLNHQKIAAEILDFKYYDFDKFLNNIKNDLNKQLVLILDHIQDPFNFGGIIRTAVSCGVNAIIIPKIKQTLVTNSVIKATTGNIFKLKIIQATNLSRLVDKLKNNNFWVFSTEMENSKDYRQVDFKDINIALIIGNESKGVSQLLIKKSDFIIKIPMKNVESLNVSVATAIILYEIRNKQKYW